MTVDVGLKIVEGQGPEELSGQIAAQVIVQPAAAPAGSDIPDQVGEHPRPADGPVHGQGGGQQGRRAPVDLKGPVVDHDPVALQSGRSGGHLQLRLWCGSDHGQHWRLISW